MEVLLKALDRALSIFVCLIYGVLTAIAFSQVIFRYFLDGSLPWSEEAVRFLFIWLSFLGFSVTMNRGGHIGVDFFVNLLPPQLKRMLALASDAVIVGFVIFLAVKGMQVVQVTKNNLSPAMQLSMGYLYMALPVSAAILLLYTLRVTCRHWHGDFGPWK